MVVVSDNIITCHKASLVGLGQRATGFDRRKEECRRGTQEEQRRTGAASSACVALHKKWCRRSPQKLPLRLPSWLATLPSCCLTLCLCPRVAAAVTCHCPQAELLSRHILKFKEIVEDLESLPRFTPQPAAQPAY